ncbi:MAG TPA: ADOP family duplicated permease [Gammaproteobacteria bacterium]|nr:ADOP family duplicated permease [Gammaproteobacteria bacterium]
MNQLKLAFRQLRLRPGLSAVVILMLALGIGATTAMFSLYHQILLRPLPLPEPERLVNLSTPGPKGGGRYRDLAINDADAQLSYAMFRDLERGQTGFTGIAGHTELVANMSFKDRPVYGRAALVSGSYFGVLGLRPTLGRFITTEDEPRVGEGAVVVLSYDYWQRELNGDPSVVGQQLTVNNQSLQIIGIAPRGFSGTVLGTRMDVFVPLTLRWLMTPTLRPPTQEDIDSRFNYWLYAFARLKPGVTLDQAGAQLNGLYSGILNEVEAPQLSGAQLPTGTLEQFRKRELAFSSGARGQSPIPAQAGRPLQLLLGVTVLVLLIVCVNIANLLLARGAARTGEIAIRASIGASRSVLVRQLLAESLVLLAIGGALSLAVAAAVVKIIGNMLPLNIGLGIAPSLSGTAMLFAAGVSLGTVLVFGVAPAWRVSGANPGRVMSMQASRTLGGRGAERFRGALTTAQIAFSMLLLVLAGLFTRSLMNIGRENLGVDVDSLVGFSITAQLNAYDQPRLAALYDRIEETLAAEPGVRGVGTTGIPLFYDFSLGAPFSVEGFDSGVDVDRNAAISAVGDGFFDALGMRLLAGREFTSQDTATAPPVVVVNQAFVRKFKLDNPVGKRVGIGITTNFPIEIVGVVADAKHDSVKGPVPPLAYLPRRQGSGAIQSLWVYVRAAVDPDTLLTTIPRVLARIDPNIPIATIQTVRARVNDDVYIDRLLSLLSAAFAALATLLAAVGLYGVLAYNVTQRTRELGLRLALGAAPARLQAMVLKQVGVMAAIGAGAGLAGALALGSAAQTVLFGLSGRDPVVFAAATAVLGLVVLAASWLPAWRASHVPPTEALRYE